MMAIKKANKYKIKLRTHIYCAINQMHFDNTPIAV